MNISSLIIVSIYLVSTMLAVRAENADREDGCDRLTERVAEAEQLYLAGQFEQAKLHLPEIIGQAESCNDTASLGWALKHLSAVYLNLKQLDKARTTAQSALDIADASGDKELKASALNVIGLCDYWQENYQSAIAYYRQALPLAAAFPELDFKIKNNMGEALYWNLQYPQAIQTFQSILPMAEQLGKLEQTVVLRNLADAYFWQGDNTRSIEYYQQVLALVDNKALRGSTHQNLAQAYSRLGDYQSALQHFQFGLPLVNGFGNSTQRAALYNGLAQTYTALKDYEQAIDMAKASIEIARNHNLHVLHSVAWGILGQALGHNKEFDRAIDAYSRAYEIASLNNLSEQIFTASIGLHLTHFELENYIQARDILENELQKDDLAMPYRLDHLKLLGQLYTALGDYNRAIDQYQQRLDIAKQSADQGIIMEALERLGDTYYSGGFYRKALDVYNQNLDLAQAGKYLQQQAVALANITWCRRALNQFDAALESAEQALKIANKADDPWTKWKALQALNQLQLFTGKGDAVNSALQIHELNREHDVLPASNSLSTLAHAYAQTGNNDSAVEHYLQALSISKENQDILEQREILKSMGELYLARGEFEKAESAYRQSIELLESTQLKIAAEDKAAVSFANNQRALYQGLVRALIEQAKIGQALQVSERGRARALANLVNQRVGNNGFEPFKSQAPTLGQIFNLARQQNITIIEYAVTLEAIYVWVISPTGSVHFEQIKAFMPSAVLSTGAMANRPTPGAVDLARLIADARGAMPIDESGQTHKEKQIEKLDALFGTLHDLLVEPISDYLPYDPDDRVVFVPQGDLFQIPFPALKDSKGHYLVEKHSIQVVPSIQLLQLAGGVKRKLSDNQSGATGRQPLIVGNPAFAGELSLSALPGAENEALSIAGILNATALTGDKATEASIREKIATASIAHFATHGLLDYGNPGASGVRDMPGAIVLAASDVSTSAEHDGLLTSAEIMQMSLNTELAVLSACNTGNGTITADGVMGLSRAFIAAGVPSVVVSLWAVPDAPTSELMVAFYRRLEQTGNKAQALRQAMLDTMKTHPNPVDWAAFILVGEA